MKNRKSLNENVFIKLLILARLSASLLFIASSIAFNVMLMFAFINFLTKTPQPTWMDANLLVTLFVAECVTFVAVLITKLWCDKIGV